MAEPIKMPFVGQTHMGRRNLVLDGGTHSPQRETLMTADRRMCPAPLNALVQFWH